MKNIFSNQEVSNEEVFIGLKLLFNHLGEENMHLPLYKINTVPVLKLKRKTQIVFIVLQCYALPFKVIFLEVGKLQFNNEGVPHNSVQPS